MELKTIEYNLSVCKVTDISDIDLSSDFFFIGKTDESYIIEQIRRMCDYAMTEGSKIRIMPDVHAGKGCTIGTTMTITDKAVPNVVGADIGCGMYTVNLGKGDVDFEKVDEAAHFIPSGMNVWEGRQERFDLTGLF